MWVPNHGSHIFFFKARADGQIYSVHLIPLKSNLENFEDCSNWVRIQISTSKWFKMLYGVLLSNIFSFQNRNLVTKFGTTQVWSIRRRPHLSNQMHAKRGESSECRWPLTSEFNSKRSPMAIKKITWSPILMAVNHLIGRFWTQTALKIRLTQWELTASHVLLSSKN